MSCIKARMLHCDCMERRRKPQSRPKAKRDYGNGVRVGFAVGNIHAALVALGHVDEDATLTKEQASRVNKAMALINAVSQEMLDEK